MQTDWRDGIGIAAGRYGKTVSWAKNKTDHCTDPAVLVLVKVRNYKYMTPESRIGLGIFAGNAYVNAEVEFYELPTNKLLGSRIYETSTSAAEGILSTATRKQVMAISTEIVDELRYMTHSPELETLRQP